MEQYAPKAMELAPRDITSRSIKTEILEGRGIGGKGYVYLDLRHLGAARSWRGSPASATSRSTSRAWTPSRSRCPIVPSQHYTMGGIDTDVDGRTVDAGPLRRRRVRLRERARRQPPGRQLAARDDRLRPPLGRGRGGRPAGRGRRGRRRSRRRPAGLRPPWSAVSRTLAARGADGDDPYAIRAEMTATMQGPLRRLPRGGADARRPRQARSASRSAAPPSACATAAASSTST